MIGAYATVAVVCAAAVIVGQAILSLGGRRDFSWICAPVGLAALLVVAGIAIKLPARSTDVAIALAVLTGLSLVWLWLSGGALGFVRSLRPRCQQRRSPCWARRFRSSPRDGWASSASAWSTTTWPTTC